MRAGAMQHMFCGRILRGLLIPLMIVLGMGAAQAAKNCPPESFIVSAGQAYDRAARSGSPSAFSSAAARYSDMNSIALYALGQYRKKLPPSRQGEYVRLAKVFMGKFMLKNGADFRVGKLTVINCTGPASNTSVNAQTESGDPVTFRVYRAGSGFQISDMKVSGIWLVGQMKSTFVGTINRAKGDIDELFKFMERY